MQNMTLPLSPDFRPPERHRWAAITPLDPGPLTLSTNDRASHLYAHCQQFYRHVICNRDGNQPTPHLR